MMVPSVSLFPVLLKREAVWGSLPPSYTELLILNYILLGTDLKKKENL